MLITVKKICSQVSMTKNYNFKEMCNSMEYITMCHFIWNWISMLPVPHSWPWKGKQDWQFIFPHLNMSCVLVHAGCCYKMPDSGWFINHIIYHCSEGQKSKIRVPAWLSAGLFQDISLNRRDEQVFQVSFTRALIPFMWALPSWPNHFPMVPPPKIITLGIRFSTYEFWKNTSI